MKDIKRRSVLNKVIPWIIPIIILIAWQVLTTTGIVAANIFPTPEKVIAGTITLIKNGQLTNNILISTKRAVIGFIIGGGIGFVLGLVNGVSRRSEIALDSTIQMVRNIPHLALMPLVIIWFGIGEEAKLFLISFGVFFPIYLNTLHGIRTIDSGLVEMGKIYGLKRRALFWNIILPGALPSILVGVRQSLGIMWLTLIVAEQLAADSGIGYMAMNAREFMQMDVIVLSIIIYAVLGKISDSAAKILELKLLRWHPNYQNN
ncbi:sulfonate transport system permease protein [Clostridium acidisoli DSM 12555]|uniref:Sulfonate transport system permease protein n=1 Tax=Clostridium acidisoli DSM 12555 TaxID=1121291 RepID=A0A1W1Y097_9CLOT|nr:ABC transporter permease subunit [Clostridium acidisoli]SMC29545.1 sulfonate transport system permease protein [Clostridium acidisoli DSM 12555]